jgi:hypothetical protein
METIQHTNEVDFESAEVETLLTLLRKVEEADSPQEAIWFGEDDLRKVESIRKHIERTTGRSQ